MKYPALQIDGADSDLVAAVVDDFSPTASEQVDTRTIVYFTDAASREGARAAVAAAFPDAQVVAEDIDDGDWARRSQENLTPITVGRIIVTPPWHVAALDTRLSSLDAIRIVILPSMGFGTGHHSTTRLCLAALQRLPLAGRQVLDVGTGSGVLALAGRALGAADATGVDVDADAIANAAENLELNPSIDRVQLRVGDLRDLRLAPADVVLANLTGALLVLTAVVLLEATKPGGHLILSGLLAAERDDVHKAFAGGATLEHEASEEGWMGLTFNRNAAATV